MSKLTILWLSVNNLVLSYCSVVHTSALCSVFNTASKIITVGYFRLEMFSGSHLTQPPAQNMAHFKVLSGFSGLHPAKA